jgi:hypothetical protein
MSSTFTALAAAAAFAGAAPLAAAAGFAGAAAAALGFAAGAGAGFVAFAMGFPLLVIEVAVDANTALDFEALADSAPLLNISACYDSISFSLVS